MNNTKLRIIVADDESVVRNYFQVTIDKLGHEVVATAGNGDELLRACRLHQPDLVITDFRMPGKDGIWTAELLGDHTDIPVIVISGYDEPDLVNLTTAQNIHAFLVKPVKPEDLKMAIALAMKKSSAPTTS